MSGTLAVNEIFGPTIQGEGPSAGRPAAFLRMAGCNLACTWCDTPYSWDWKRYDRHTEVLQMLPANVAADTELVLPPALLTEAPLLVVSGGEPMLQQRVLPEVFTLLPGWLRLEIETAGTRAPEPEFDRWVTQYNVSLKLAHSLNPLQKRVVPAALRALSDTGKVVWKFVAQQPSDLNEADQLIRDHDLRGPVYVMPEGTTAGTLASRARDLVPAVITRGWHLTPRLHIDLWGTERGR